MGHPLGEVPLSLSLEQTSIKARFQRTCPTRSAASASPPHQQRFNLRLPFCARLLKWSLGAPTSLCPSTTKISRRTHWATHHCPMSLTMVRQLCLMTSSQRLVRLSAAHLCPSSARASSTLTI